MKRLLSSIIILLVTLTGTAQVRFGVKAGVALSSTTALHVPNVGDFSTKGILGPTAGVLLDIKAGNLFGVQAELNYAMRGYRDECDVDDTSGAVPQTTTAQCTHRSSMLELPILLKFYPIKLIGLNVQVGPQVGYLIDRSLSADVASFDPKTFNYTNRKLDAGIVFGLGYELKRWSIDARYYLGLMKNYTDLEGIKNRGLTFALGYRF